MTSNKIKEIREFFLALKQRFTVKTSSTFDNAASTLKHSEVLKELDQHYYHETANIHRGVHFLSELGTQKYEKNRGISYKIYKCRKET